jgi:hypothetical protein
LLYQVGEIRRLHSQRLIGLPIKNRRVPGLADVLTECASKCITPKSGTDFVFRHLPLTVAVGQVIFCSIHDLSSHRSLFYGLFMDADLLRAKGAHPVNIRPACVPGFALRIGQRATLLRIPDACAYGIVMELTHVEIEQLYSEASVGPSLPLCTDCPRSRCGTRCIPQPPKELEVQLRLTLLIRKIRPSAGPVCGSEKK